MARSSTHGRYSASEGRWYGRKFDDGGPAADPYAPASPDYAARTRERIIKLPNGLLRVDYGAATDPDR